MRNHPDAHKLDDWHNFGPSDPEIAILVSKLAYDHRLRLDEIEGILKHALRTRYEAAEDKRTPAPSSERTVGSEVLRGLQPAVSRPWQLEMTSTSQFVELPDEDAVAALTRMFEYAPELRSVTIETTKGNILVRKVLPWDSPKTADAALDGFFKNSSTATGVNFGNHTATPDAPYISSTGKAYTEAKAAFECSQITSEEMRTLLVGMQKR